MSDELAGRAYLVTGGGSGIGAAVAAALRSAGADVLVGGRRAEHLRRVAEAIGAAWCPADVTREADVASLVAAAREAFGRLDGVVSNAGVMTTGTVLDTEPAEWDRSLETNLRSAYLLARAAVPVLLDSGGGAFVTVSSIAGLRSSTGAAAYSTGKAALIALTQSLAVDFAPRGLRANVVCPGWVRTEMADAEMDEFAGPDGGRERAYSEVTALVPQRRPAAAAEVAEAVVWLCGPRSSYVNGAVLTVDGGTTLVDAGTVPFDFTVAPRQS